MKKLAFVGGVLVAAAGVSALLIGNQKSQAADHLDAPGAAPAAQSLTDINDLYSWMSTDGSKLNLVMTVAPAATTATHFGPSVQYVFHVNSKTLTQVGMPAAGTETKVICTFASDTSAQCWVGATGYIKGDPSAAAGITSTDGKIRLFAGLRSDPFFFNLQGFRDAVAAVDNAELPANGGPIPTNAAGCPAVPGATGAALLNVLKSTSANTQVPCSPASRDCFAGLNGLAIVLQIDKTLVNSGANTLVGVWASSHTAP